MRLRVFGPSAVLVMLTVGLYAVEGRAELNQDVNLTHVPLYSQDDSRWGIFDMGPVSIAGKQDDTGPVNISRCGCHLTSLSMAFEGLKQGARPWYPHPQIQKLNDVWTFVPELSFSPKYMNDYFNMGPKVGGTTSGFIPGSGGTTCRSGVYPWAAELMGDGGGIFPTGMTWTEQTAWSPATQLAVDSNLLRGYPTIVHRSTAAGGRHANIIVGWDNTKKKYLIYDPLWTSTGAEVAGHNYDDGLSSGTEDQRYQRYMNAIRVVYVLELVTSGLRWLYVKDDPEPIKMRLTDPRGRRTGYDPVTNENVQEDGAAFFSESTSFADPLLLLPEAAPFRYVAVRNPDVGGYGLEVFGTGDGPFKLTIGTAQSGREQDAATVTGTIVSGGVKRYEIVRAADGNVTIEAVAAFGPRARAGNDASVFLGRAGTFDGRGSYQVGGEIAGYSWDFGDGASASGAQQTHTYAAAGIHKATLTVTNAAGLSGKDERTVLVIDPASLPQMETLRVDVTAANAQTQGAVSPKVTPDGRYVVFESPGADLVAGDTNAVSDVFVKDLSTGVIERASVATGGAQGTDASSHPSVSADGRFVVFVSSAKNFYTGDVDFTPEVFIRDRTLGTTALIAASSSTSSSPGASLSADGSFVLFSTLNALVAADPNATEDLYLYERVTGVVRLASADAAGTATGVYDTSRFVGVSGTGRFVCFMTSAPIDVIDTNGALDIYVRDLMTGTTELVSRSDTGGNIASSSYYPQISDDGRFVTFESPDAGVVAGDTNGTSDVFVRDRLLATTERVSVSSTGQQADSISNSAAVSPDGRYVAFFSKGDNIGPSGTLTLQAYVRDRQLQTTTRVSVDNSSVEASPAVNPSQAGSPPASVTLDGAVAFMSNAPNLVANDTNGATDVFIRRLVPSSGAATTPLANLGGPYLGWASSAAVPAAILFDGSASGDPKSRTLIAHWDFGDGTPVVDGALSTPHAYAQPGVYKVSLTVSAGANASAPASADVEVMPALAPALISAGGCAPPDGVLTLTGSVVTANAALVAGGWDTSTGKIPINPAIITMPWGDVNAPAALPGLSFRKDTTVPATWAGGSFVAKLAGAKDATFDVPCATRPNKQPQAVAGGPLYDTQVGVPVILDGSASSDGEGSPLTYRWFFGDGTTGTGAKPEHTYALEGGYMVTLIVNDGTEDSADMIGTHSFAMVQVHAAPSPGGGEGCGCSTSRSGGQLGFGVGAASLLLLARRRRRAAA